MSVGELLDPRRLSESLKSSSKMGRGITIFVISLASAVGSSVFYESFKVNVSFLMPTLANIEPPGASIRDIAFARTTYVIIGLLVVLSVIRISLFIAGARGRSSKPLLSATFHSFAAMLVATLILLPAVITAPEIDVSIVSVELGNVKMEGVKLLGSSLQDSSTIEINAAVLRAEKLKGEMLFKNGTRPDWEVGGVSIGRGELVESIILESASARIDDAIVELGDVKVEALSWDRIEFSEYDPIQLYPITGPNILAGTLTVATWVWIVVYSLIAVKPIYSLSTRTILIIGSLTIFALLTLGLI